MKATTTTTLQSDKTVLLAFSHTTKQNQGNILIHVVDTQAMMDSGTLTNISSEMVKARIGKDSRTGKQHLPPRLHTMNDNIRTET